MRGEIMKVIYELETIKAVGKPNSYVSDHNKKKDAN